MHSDKKNVTSVQCYWHLNGMHATQATWLVEEEEANDTETEKKRKGIYVIICNLL